jgi:hypothetical protein
MLQLRSRKGVSMNVACATAERSCTDIVRGGQPLSYSGCERNQPLLRFNATRNPQELLGQRPRVMGRLTFLAAPGALAGRVTLRVGFSL